MKTAWRSGSYFGRAALVAIAALAIIGPAVARAEPTPVALSDLASLLPKGAAPADSKDKFWETLTKILGLVAAAPAAAGGVAYLVNYLNGRGRLVRDRQIFESQKVTLDLIEQIVRIEALKKSSESPLAEPKISDAYNYTSEDFYRTLIALRANVQLRGAVHARARALPAPELKFREIRQRPAWLRYFVVPRPRTPLAMLVTALYYYLALVVGVALLIMILAAFSPGVLDFGPIVNTITVLVVIAAPAFLMSLLLRWIWGQLFKMRERFEARVGQAHDMAAAMALTPAAGI